MVEIERKFLVVSDEFRSQGAGKRISQGYICATDGRVVRVRVYGDKAFLTIKTSTIGFSRDEWEYEIPVDEAEDMLKKVCPTTVIEKIRYRYLHDGFWWDVDEFFGRHEGIVVAEIELPSEETTFSKPAFVGEEVTGNPQYYNAVMAKTTM